MKQKQNNKHKLTTIVPTILIHPSTQNLYPLELNESDWLGYAAKLDEAMRAKTKSQLLSPCERERFERNCELIRRVNMADEVRNYVMLEIHQAKQWRADFRNVVELAKSFGISKSQFYKALKSAQINIQMAEAGLYQLKPKGRHVELLAKIEPKHRVAAWQHALNAADKKGGSSKVIERALDDYEERLNKHDDEVDGTDPIRSQPLQTLTKAKRVSDTKVDDVIGWITNLSPTEERGFKCLLTLDTWCSSQADSNLSQGASMAYELIEAAYDHLNTTRDIDNTRDALRVAISKDPRLKRAFFNLGLHLISQHINARFAEKHPL